jgi:hypothetical protein
VVVVEGDVDDPHVINIVSAHAFLGLRGVECLPEGAWRYLARAWRAAMMHDLHTRHRSDHTPRHPRDQNHRRRLERQQHDHPAMISNPRFMTSFLLLTFTRHFTRNLRTASSPYGCRSPVPLGVVDPDLDVGLHLPLVAAHDTSFGGAG